MKLNIEILKTDKGYIYTWYTGREMHRLFFDRFSDVEWKTADALKLLLKETED